MDADLAHRWLRDCVADLWCPEKAAARVEPLPYGLRCHTRLCRLAMSLPILRSPTPADADRCFEIESAAYEGDEAATYAKIATRIAEYPQGFLTAGGRWRHRRLHQQRLRAPSSCHGRRGVQGIVSMTWPRPTW